MIHKKNICEELLSRARLAPAKFLSCNLDSDNNLLSEIMNSVRLSTNKKSKSQQDYLETTNFVVGKDNKIETSISILYFFYQPIVLNSKNLKLN